MSRRVIRYEGEGRRRRPVYADEGPASASALGIMAILGKGGMPNRELASPSGGAGPIERRQISEAEAAIRREATPTQRAWNGGPIQAQLAATPTPNREQPTMPETPPQAAQEPAPRPAGADCPARLPQRRGGGSAPGVGDRGRGADGLAGRERGPRPGLYKRSPESRERSRKAALAVGERNRAGASA